MPRSVWVDTSYVVEDWGPGCWRADRVWVGAHKIRRIVPGGYWATTQDRVWVEAGYE